MKLLQSVKFRLTLWYAFILTVLLSIFAFWMYEEFSRTLYHDVDKSLIYETRSLEESLMLPPEAQDRIGTALQDWEKGNRRLRRSILMVRLVGMDHRVLLSNLKAWEREIIFPDFERDSFFMEKGQSFQTIHFRKMPVRLYYRRISQNGQPLFMFQMGAPLQELKKTLDRLAFIILISIPGAVLAACVAGWFLARRFFQPIDLMIREARQITAAYLKSRLPRTKSGDELDRLAETLNEMIDRLESSTRSIQDFSSDISHELKTPLAIIRGEIDLALRKERSPESLVQTLHVIEGEVNELIRLVDDLLLLVRTDAKQLRFDKRRVSLQAVLSLVAHRYQERMKSKKIAFEYQINSDAEVFGDELYLKRLFGNLVDNAIKFTPEGGRITMSLAVGGQRARVEIVDTGMGIELEMQQKVFSRFFRTDQARSQEGAGLGLNIVKAIADAHGAEINIHSHPGQGTRIRITFPSL